MALTTPPDNRVRIRPFLQFLALLGREVALELFERKKSLLLQPIVGHRVADGGVRDCQSRSGSEPEFQSELQRKIGVQIGPASRVK